MVCTMLRLRVCTQCSYSVHNLLYTLPHSSAYGGHVKTLIGALFFLAKCRTYFLTSVDTHAYAFTFSINSVADMPCQSAVFLQNEKKKRNIRGKGEVRGQAEIGSPICHLSLYKNTWIKYHGGTFPFSGVGRGMNIYTRVTRCLITSQVKFYGG